MAEYRYHALAALPEGGGRAYLGLAIIDDARAEPVVLVWVPEELAADIEKSEKIQRETERAALLEHPHIIRVYGFARLEQGLARVVEFADGENLRRVLKQSGSLPARLAARLIADAAQGVHYAHLAGNDDGTPLLHGDLRPETLLVSYGGSCKVSGYGASAFARDATVRFRRVAPEQLLGGRGAMNVQTDVYLLGATLFEIITGRAPFEDADNFEDAVLNRPLDLEKYPLIPDPLKPVIARALAKKAKDRFPSAQLFREALELAWPKLPDEAEVSRWLNDLFPDRSGARAERRQLIDGGIASYARAQWDKQASQPTTQAPFPAVSPPAPRTKQASPAQTQAQAPAQPLAQPATPPAPVLADEERTIPEQPTRRSRGPLFAGIGALIAAAAFGGYSLARSSVEPGAQLAAEAVPPVAITETGPAAAATADAPDAGEALAQADGADAGPAKAAAAATDDSVLAELLEESQTATEPASAQAGASVKPAVAAPAKGTLALTVEPAVSVEVDGQPMGRSPLRVAVEPGRRRIRLLDRANGIDITRSVTVPSGGVANEQIYLQRGFLSITAPPGAVIEIDGKQVGTAPLKQDVQLYEGSHRIEVRVGGATWRDTFTVRPNQRVYFDVGPQYQ